MSDSIERTRRQETLKGLIQELHAGKSVAEVKGAFAELVRDIGAEEIAELEQNLIADGLPESEVKRLCDVHVAVFRESLDAQAAARPETIPGHPVHTFLAENAACGPVLEGLGRSLEGIKSHLDAESLARARQELAHLREFEKHYLRKENLLFPYLEKHGFSGPSSVMWAIHDDIRAVWKKLDALLSAGPGGDPPGFVGRVEEVASPLKTAIQEMFYKEENILFPTALQKLSHQDWVEIRQQEADIGYSYVQPGDGWLPVAAVHTEVGDLLSLPTTAPASSGQLELQTGFLTPQQVDLILTHLPVEITFVDEHDRVRFFSQSKEVLFPRSPAIIGRQVQNCHPPASVDKVQRILDDFRANRRDAAEFWIRMRGMLIYIRYFALRDGDGAYRGTLEVTQEITRIQSLEGERRLLDES
jgi:DUF438 domain-containing protein